LGLFVNALLNTSTSKPILRPIYIRMYALVILVQENDFPKYEIKERLKYYYSSKLDTKTIFIPFALIFEMESFIALNVVKCGCPIAIPLPL